MKWKFERKNIGKYEVKYEIKELEEWKPEEGTHRLIIDLGREPEIIMKKYSNKKVYFACFLVELRDKERETRRKWCIKIAGVKEMDGTKIIEVWQKSQRGEALAQIAEEYGYQPHLIVVQVHKDNYNKLNTRYQVTHSEDCMCLKRKDNSTDDNMGEFRKIAYKKE